MATRLPLLRTNFAYNGAHNKSLDASGFSGSLIDNLSVAQLFPAASTQSLSRRDQKVRLTH